MIVGDLIAEHELMRVRQRQEMVEYYVDHAHGQFYIITNSNALQEYQVLPMMSAGRPTACVSQCIVRR